MENKSNESKNLVQFYCEIEKLKHLDRSGWTIQGRNIGKPESVAGHMYRMAIMAMAYIPDHPDQPIDQNKLVQMALVHDMAECIVGDITPFDGISKEEKHLKETNAMNYLVSLLPDKRSQEFNQLFTEYESQESFESKVVKEFDRFDVMLQAFQYERREWQLNKRIVRFQEFFDNCVGKLSSKQLLKMFDEINKDRDLFWAEVGAQQ